MERAIPEEDIIKELSRRSLIESMKYDWDKTAEEYLKYLFKFIVYA
jgi:glycosyltransferase involved in cell wall biosynthesis